MATYTLQPKPDVLDRDEAGGRYGLGSRVLARNADWFIHVRWIVAVVFAASGIASFVFRADLDRTGMELPGTQLLVLSATLAVVNALFIVWSRTYVEPDEFRKVKLFLWVQIVFDLLIVTAAVYFVGSTESFVAFTYLFHVVLSCIFFERRESLAVMLVASLLYLVSVSLELIGVLPERAMYSGTGIGVGDDRNTIVWFHVLSAVFVWFVVWYLASTLSEGVRKRDMRLRVANERLTRANREKNQQMLVTTHDLKAPFSGIESNIEVLKVGYWEELTPETRRIIDRIKVRSENLRARINEILLLGKLRTDEASAGHSPEIVNLSEVVESVCSDLEEQAGRRSITLNRDVSDVQIRVDRFKLVVLLSNLIANAINYSHDGGVVEIEGSVEAGDSDVVGVIVRDHGIGIREDALPRVFDEFYRSREAAEFNRSSTGLGLSIVKEIVFHLGMELSVESEEGEGTSMHIRIPKEPENDKGGPDAQDHDHRRRP